MSSEVSLSAGVRIIQLDPVKIEVDYQRVKPSLVATGKNPGSLDGNSLTETIFEKEYWAVADEKGNYVRRYVQQSDSSRYAYYIKALQKVIYSTPEYARADLLKDINEVTDEAVGKSILSVSEIRQLKTAATWEFLNAKAEFSQLNETEKNVLVHCLLDPCGPCKIAVIETWRSLQISKSSRGSAFVAMINYINDTQINRTIRNMIEDWENGGSMLKPIELASN